MFIRTLWYSCSVHRWIESDSNARTPSWVLCSLTVLFRLGTAEIDLLCVYSCFALLYYVYYWVFFVCFLFFVCMMLSWSIPGTECSSSEIDQAAQSLLLIFKQRSRITLPLDAQIRLSGIMMISVILYWNRGKKILTASHALLRHTQIVSMWGRFWAC